MSGVGRHEEARPSVPPEKLDDTISSGLLEMFLALMPDAAVVVDGEGRIVSASSQTEAMFGYDAGELIGRPVELLVPERYRYQHRQHRAGFAREPRAREMGAGLDLAGRRRDGSEFPVDISLAPVTGAERPLVVAAIRDATERRAAVAAQAQLAAIVQSSLDAVIAMTLQGTVTAWNPGATHLFGYRPEEIIGVHISLLVPPRESQELEELLDAIIASRPVTPRDTEWQDKNGGRVPVAISLSPMTDTTGKLIGFSVLARDITERKHAEAELRRLLAEGRRQARWQSASAEIRLALLSGMPLEASLNLICQRASELLSARAAAIVTAGQDPHVVAGAGEAKGLPGAPLVPTPAVVTEAHVTGTTQTASRLLGPADSLLDDAVAAALDAGPVVAAPILSDRGVAGVLLVVDPTDDQPSELEDMVESLSGQAALAVELGRAREDRERLLLTSDRERIARDLHDLVIQRLFATGMGLQGVLRLIDNPRASERVEVAVDDLDATIREIRSAIFALETPVAAASGLRAEVLRLADSFSESLGFEPTVRFDGPIDSAVTDEVEAHVLAVVREALSNVSRHARATRAEVDLAVNGNLLVVVTDNGIGLGGTDRESGLGNLRSRAEDLGGTMRLESPPGGGTRLEWAVPVRP